MKKLARHLPHYLSLFAILAFGALGFVLVSTDRAFQLSVAAATATAYVAWGIIHHAYHEDLYLPVLIEYVLVAALGLIIVFSTLYRV